jgi:carboxyl-terminal processing protease
LGKFFYVARWSGTIRSVVIGVILINSAQFCSTQAITPAQRDEAQRMLRDVAEDVRQNYYDRNFHGVDWDAKVREASGKIDKADSLNRALTAIAAALDSLSDSHTFFLPPERPYVNDYGFEMQMIGSRCYVTHVRPDSDAEKKGIKPGDEIETLNGYTPTRETFQRMHYLFWILRPQPGFNLRIRSVAGEEREVDVLAKFVPHSKVVDLYEMNYSEFSRDIGDQYNRLGIRYAHRDYDVLMVRLPIFYPFQLDAVDSILSKTEGFKAVIFDLRGNPGGSAEMVQSLLGAILDHKVKIADRVERNKTTPMQTEHHFHPFTGKVAVLVDSQSASASEIFARVVQLEKRGTVLGDGSSGMVMEALQFHHTTQGEKRDNYILYGSEVTHADLIMTDGKSLERTGVAPDLAVLPTASDLANGRDPVLAKAAELVGVTITPEDAGKLFPYEWPPDSVPF